MKKRSFAAVCLVFVLVFSTMAVSAFAADKHVAPDVATEDRDRNITLDLIFEPVGSLNDASRFYRGDVAVLAATVTNKTDAEISGKLSIYDPALKYLDVIAEPICNDDDILTISAHDSETIAYVVEFSGEPDPEMPVNWKSTAMFEFETGGVMSVNIDCAYGVPDLRLGLDAVKANGRILVSNAGDGGASNVRFRFYAKADAISDSDLPEGVTILDDGRVEIGLGAIVPDGVINRDMSAVILDKIDLSKPWELVFADAVTSDDVIAGEGLISQNK